jgi:hypothetical protein
MLIILVGQSWAQNYERTVLYYYQGIGNKVSTDFTDGFGRTIQKQVTYDGGVLLQGTEYDDVLKYEITTKPVWTLSGTSDYNSNGYFSGDIFTLTNQYYSGSNGLPASNNRAFVENRYENNPLSRLLETINPGHQASDSKGLVKYNYAGVAGLEISYDDFIVTEAGSNYLLSQTKNENEDLANTWQDLFGRTIKTEQFVSIGYPIISSREYDVVGNVTMITDPRSLVSEYQYTTRDQIAQKTTPDETGATEYIYDLNGRLRLLKDPQGGASGYYYAYKYDFAGRQVSVWKMASAWGSASARQADAEDPGFPTTNAWLLNANYFDELPSSLPLPEGMHQSDFQNLRGRLACAVAVVEPEMGGTLYPENIVTTWYSYNDDGNIEMLVTSVPGLSPKTVRYRYNLQDQVDAISSEIDGKPFTFLLSYNDAGWLSEIQDSATGILELTVTYLPDGTVRRKELGRNSSGKPLQGIDYVYHIRGWLKKINYQNLQGVPVGGIEQDPGHDGDPAYTNRSPYNDLFGQQLFYDETGAHSSPQYNGNISWQIYNINNSFKGVSSANPVRGFSYQYDGLNRMKKSLAGFWDGTSETWVADYGYSTVVNYDANGNIIGQKQRFPATPPEPSAVNNYVYKSNTNQLDHLISSVTDDFGGPKTAPDVSGTNNTEPYGVVGGTAHSTYEYDANGNMVRDRSKGLIISYDWRNLPILFEFDINGAKKTVQMVYDAGGNRVAKVEK